MVSDAGLPALAIVVSAACPHCGADCAVDQDGWLCPRCEASWDHAGVAGRGPQRVVRRQQDVVVNVHPSEPEPRVVFVPVHPPGGGGMRA